MLMLTLALTALAGSMMFIGPFGTSDADDTPEPLEEDQTETGTGDLLDASAIPEWSSPAPDTGPNLPDTSSLPADDTNWTGPEAGPAPLPVPSLYDALPGAHLSDVKDASMTAGPAITNDAITGSSDADSLTGGASGDLMMGNEGADTLAGGAGDDYLDGGAEDDLLLGGFGDDQLRGMAGDDRLQGGEGADLMAGDDGDDTLLGGGGDDRLFAGRGADSLLGGAGNDLLDGSLYENGVGDTGADTLDGGDGNDTIALGSADVGIGGAGADLFLLGGSGIYAPDADYPLPRILDFDPDTDSLELVIEGDAPGDVTTIEENGGITVLVGADPVAHLEGVANLSPTLIRITAA